MKISDLIYAGIIVVLVTVWYYSNQGMTQKCEEIYEVLQPVLSQDTLSLCQKDHPWQRKRVSVKKLMCENSEIEWHETGNLVIAFFSSQYGDIRVVSCASCTADSKLHIFFISEQWKVCEETFL